MDEEQVMENIEAITETMKAVKLKKDEWTWWEESFWCSLAQTLPQGWYAGPDTRWISTHFWWKSSFPLLWSQGEESGSQFSIHSLTIDQMNSWQLFVSVLCLPTFPTASSFVTSHLQTTSHFNSWEREPDPCSCWLFNFNKCMIVIMKHASLGQMDDCVSLGQTDDCVSLGQMDDCVSLGQI